MASNNITTNQLTACLLTTVAGRAMMNASSIFYRNFGQNAIIAIGLIFAITIILILTVVAICQKSDYIEPYSACLRALGKIGGSFLYGIICLYLLALAVMSLKIFIYILNLYYLQRTPILVIALLIIVPVLYTAYGGLRTFAHTASLIYLLLAIFFLIFLFTKNNYTFTYLFPLANSALGESLKNLPWCFVTSTAIMSLFFWLPALTNRQKIKKSVIVFTLIALGIFLAIYIIARTYFGDAIKDLILPFFNLSSRYGVGPFERLDVLFILIFIPVMGLFATFHFVLFYKAQKLLLPKINNRRPGAVLIIFGLLIAFLAAFIRLNNLLWQTMLLSNYINLALIFL
ncbi:MAG: GerAB/ArcD/ProY family transporter, partial [Bacillota bacterium]|nr:GerAB/ArcD/ProY family transporter [Bacillota bacterium]